MNRHYLVVEGQYPWGVSPLLFGYITLSCKFFVLIIWMLLTLSGHNYFLLMLIAAFIPEFRLYLFKLNRDRKNGWIIRPLLNTMRSAGMVELSRPIYRTIFGYYKIERAPIFFVDKKQGGYLLTFKANGCPHANRDFLPILQEEMYAYEIIPQGNVKKQFFIRKRAQKGRKLTNEDFY